MRINNINPRASFGHKIIIDIGASNPKGTMKALVKSESGEVIYKTDGTLNTTSRGFSCYDTYTRTYDEGQSDFISKLHDVIKNVHDEVVEKEKNGEIQFESTRDSKLTGVAVFVPGTTFTMCKDDRIAFIPNLKNAYGDTLENIDFKAYEKAIKAGDDRTVSFNVSDDFELEVTKDLGGTGLGIAKKMADKDMLKPGDYIMGIMTGGGFGSVDIKVKGHEQYPVVEFETSESRIYLTGNVLMYDKIKKTVSDILKSDNPNEQLRKLTANDNKELVELIPILGKIGRQGVSVKSHLKCFFEALDLDVSKYEYNELINLALEIGDARIVADDFMYISKKDGALVEKVKKCKYFEEIESDKDDKLKFTLNKKVLDPDKIKEARIHAVNDYANAVSLISINKINDCINKVVLVGPFAQGLNRHVKENPEDYGATDLTDLILQKINTNIDPKHADLPTTKRLMKLYNFEIICDPEINISNNTDCGELLLQKKLSFTPNRGSWFSIPLNVLKYS